VKCIVVICDSSSWCETCGAQWDTGDEPIPCKAGTAVGASFARGVEMGKVIATKRIVAWLRERAVKRAVAANALTSSNVLHMADEAEHSRLNAAYAELWTAADELEDGP